MFVQLVEGRKYSYPLKLFPQYVPHIVRCECYECGVGGAYTRRCGNYMGAEGNVGGYQTLENGLCIDRAEAHRQAT